MLNLRDIRRGRRQTYRGQSHRGVDGAERAQRDRRGRRGSSAPSAPAAPPCAPAADSAAISSSAMPPSGPTTSINESACARDSSVSWLGRRLVQHQHRRTARHRLAHVGQQRVGRRQRRSTAGCTAAATAGRPTGPPRASAASPCRPSAAVPAGHAARCLPGHERVGARLGGQLDRQLGAVGLGQRLHDGDRRRRGARRSGGPAPAPSAWPLRDVLDDTVRHVPAPSPRSSSSPDPDAAHVGGVEALVTVDDGRAHRPRAARRRRRAPGSCPVSGR